MTTTQKKWLAAIIVPVQVFLAVLAWRDLARRSEAEVRAGKNMWRAFILINPGNAMFYWLFGRRRLLE